MKKKNSPRVRHEADKGCPQVIAYRGSRGRQRTYNLKTTLKFFDAPELSKALYRRRPGSANLFFMVDYGAYDGSNSSLEIKELTVKEARKAAADIGAPAELIRLIRAAGKAEAAAQERPREKIAVTIDADLKRRMIAIQKRRAAYNDRPVNSHDYALGKAVEEACRMWVAKFEDSAAADFDQGSVDK